MHFGGRFVLYLTMKEEPWRGVLVPTEREHQHSLIADPLFVNAAQDDYRLQPNSPAFKLGFQPIPVEKIGPYKDELRASWPIKQAEGAREKPLSP